MTKVRCPSRVVPDVRLIVRLIGTEDRYMPTHTGYSRAQFDADDSTSVRNTQVESSQSMSRGMPPVMVSPRAFPSPEA